MHEDVDIRDVWSSSQRSDSRRISSAFTQRQKKTAIDNIAAMLCVAA